MATAILHAAMAMIGWSIIAFIFVIAIIYCAIDAIIKEFIHKQ